MNSSGKQAVAAKPQSLLRRVFATGVSGWRKGLTAAVVLLAIGVAYHIIFGQNGITAYEQKRHDNRVLESQLKSLQHENELLKGHVDRLQNDPDAIEHQAREELHYARPGEVIYTLPQSPSPSPQIHAAGSNATPGR